MPSRSLSVEWNGKSKVALDKMEGAHKAIEGTGRGRRYATQQVNQGYLILVASHFQLFCRKLHSETVDHLTNGMPNTSLRDIVQAAMTSHRALDRGNANAQNLGSDFAALGMLNFWDRIKALSTLNKDRHLHLEAMNVWRNAIAHQDFSKLKGRTEIRLRDVRTYRRACNGLAVSFDKAALSQIKAIAGPSAGW